ncbi:MAG: 50S ribosomal protein L22 [Symbiobacterium thermophilum]|uniref:Large ribosomal subunit protein uL22 n=1 Tax=Symbiobacterium thermophilum TaxID=2734 RepID=A0A1Y2T714_SYMTR|nr:MAG: 50S ribosomal protein L22 [Symbiobacterium thermophilum]PZN70991.1 MAG: 50S ribosomal protein L22 [Bacillota bacterium]
MEVKASARYVRIAPRKVRVVIDLVRGKSVNEALALLKFIPKRAAVPVAKVIASAAANAEHNYNLNRDNLYIAKAYVDQGPTLKRYHPRQRGQAFPILKRTSHITVVVKEKEAK